MDTPLAPPVRSALQAAVERGDTGYAHADGLPETYASFAADRFGWSPDPARMVLVPDVMQGIVNVLRAVSEPGAAVVVNTPAYPPFFSFLHNAGWRVVESPLARSGDGYALDLDRLADDLAAPGVVAYLLCNPHNPTGLVLSAAELAGIAELAASRGRYVLADEVHAPLTYPGVVHVPYLSVPGTGPAFAFVSASKAWNLAGLKAALVVTGPEGADDLARLPIEVSFGAGLFGVIAAEAAFRHGLPWLESLLAGLDRNRRLLGELLASELPDVGYQPPQATYLAWLDCTRLGLGDDPAEAFERDGRVAVNPGPQFGAPGRGHVRVNLATRPDLLAEGVRRMAHAVAVRSG